MTCTEKPDLRKGRQSRLNAVRRIGLLRRFSRNEDGVMMVFSLLTLVFLLMVGGLAVDLMRHETTRTKLQATLDRAVLAAADMDQQLDPELVVQQYFEKSGMAAYLTSTTVDQGLNFRRVDATARFDMDTTFMRLSGVKTLTAPASGAAEERQTNVEISMALDISGSMRFFNRMENLEDAAHTFIDTVLTDENADKVSMSIVPYSEHVNVGPDIFNQLNKIHRHNFSHCVEIPNGHFTSTSLALGHTYEQVQHYQWNNHTNLSRVVDTVCPRYSYERITPLSQNRTQLKNQISALQPRAGTSIFLGMKWATALLDPGSQGIVNTLIAQNKVDNAFAGRPVAYNDPETLKTIILMTDGQNDRSYRIANSYYANSSHYNHWNNNNFWRYLELYVSSWQRPNWYWQKYTAPMGDALTNDICTAAKQAGIVIWAVAFEVEDHGANVMRSCASSPSHFFRVEGVDIVDAFRTIARHINQLRLVL